MLTDRDKELLPPFPLADYHCRPDVQVAQFYLGSVWAGLGTHGSATEVEEGGETFSLDVRVSPAGDALVWFPFVSRFLLVPSSLSGKLKVDSLLLLWLSI